MADAFRGQGAGLSAGPCAPVPAVLWRRVFAGERSQLSVVRRWIESLLPACPARDDLAVVATELAGNAVLHTASGRGGWFAVEITRSRQIVRVAVTDRGAPGGSRVIDPDGEHGRGLLVVAGLSVRSGVRGDAAGRQVWADICWDEAAAAWPQAAELGYLVAMHFDHGGTDSRPAGLPAWPGQSTAQSRGA